MFTASCAPAGELRAGERRVAINACYQQQNKKRVESFQPHSFDHIRRKKAVFSDFLPQKNKKKHNHHKTRGRRGQEEMQCLFWVKAKGYERSSWGKRDYEGDKPSTTDTENLQLLSLNQVPSLGVRSAMPSYPGGWCAEPSCPIHPTFPRFNPSHLPQVHSLLSPLSSLPSIQDTEPACSWELLSLPT